MTLGSPRARATARRVVIVLTGGTLVVVGVAMIVLPGPATLVIPAGLTILGREFAWARRAVDRGRQQARALAGLLRRRPPTG